MSAAGNANGPPPSRGSVEPRDGGWLGVVERVTGALARAGAWVGAAIVLAMALFAGYGIFTRYVLDHSQTWVDELSGYLMVLVVMLGAAEALRRADHIAVDALTERFGPRGKRAVEAIGLVAVLFVAGVIFVGAWSDVRFEYRVGEVTEGYLGIQKWIPKSSLVLGMALLILAAVNRLLRLVLGRA
ncbi:MAG: TRAP transporter small permease [Rhodospirillaceae bacterium]|nr:TRAP transporter small permease [Rhodospirillaceae bacterium]